MNHECMGRFLRVLAVTFTTFCGLAVAGPAGAATYDTHLTRAPYLTDLVGLHVIVNFATDKTGTTASVAYGSASGGTCNLTSTQAATRISVTVGSLSHYQWRAPLTLPISGQYCYRPKLGSTDLLGTGASPVFTTQAPALTVCGPFGRGIDLHLVSRPRPV